VRVRERVSRRFIGSGREKTVAFSCETVADLDGLLDGFTFAENDFRKAETE
jgi:hypothetical protein